MTVFAVFSVVLHRLQENVWVYESGMFVHVGCPSWCQNTEGSFYIL